MWYEAEGNYKPSLLEIIGKIYIVRKNIKDISYKDDEGREVTMFSYKEAKMTESEYQMFMATERNYAYAYFIAMTLGIDLPSDENEESNEGE